VVLVKEGVPPFPQSYVKINLMSPQVYLVADAKRYYRDK
jgi:hypothetical protein